MDFIDSSFMDLDETFHVAFDEAHRLLKAMMSGSWLNQEKYDKSINPAIRRLFAFLTESQNPEQLQDRVRALRVGVDRVVGMYVASTDSTAGTKNREAVLAFCRAATSKTAVEFAEQELNRLVSLREECLSNWQNSLYLGEESSPSMDQDQPKMDAIRPPTPPSPPKPPPPPAPPAPPRPPVVGRIKIK